MLCLIFIVYVLAVFSLLVFKWLPFWKPWDELRPEPLPIRDQVLVNRQPGASIRRYLRHLDNPGAKPAAWLNIGGNILVMVPFGMVLSLLISGPWAYPIALLAGLFFIQCIELSQLVFALGYWDIDDIILNSCGLICGICCALPIKRQVARARLPYPKH